MSNCTYFFFVGNILLSNKFCLCCSVDMHLYSKSLSTIGTIYSLILSERFPAFFYRNNKIYLSQSSSSSDD